MVCFVPANHVSPPFGVVSLTYAGSMRKFPGLRPSAELPAGGLIQTARTLAAAVEALGTVKLIDFEDAAALPSTTAKLLPPSVLNATCTVSRGPRSVSQVRRCAMPIGQLAPAEGLVSLI